MKLRNIAIGAGVVVAVVIAAAVYFLLNSLDAIVERAIERYGSEITGTAVRVASVDISLSSGRGTVRGLTVGNPKGFSSDSTFSLEEITLQIDVGTVTSSPIVIDEITIRAPAVLFEVNQAGAANVDEIRKNAERYRPAAGEEAEPVRLLIRKFLFERGEIAADTTALGGKEMEAKLPPLTLSNVGGRQGATPGEIGKIMVKAMTRQVATAVASQQVGSYLEKKIDEEIGGKVGEAAKDLLRSLAK
jgi:uncharacterized protein involved in outer membrane biogenesis